MTGRDVGSGHPISDQSDKECCGNFNPAPAQRIRLNLREGRQIGMTEAGQLNQVPGYSHVYATTFQATGEQPVGRIGVVK